MNRWKVYLLALLPVVTAAATASAGMDVRFDGATYHLGMTGATAFHETANRISGEHMVAVPGSPAVLMLWNEATPTGSVPFYAISLDGTHVDRVRQANYDIMLRAAQFDPGIAVPAGAPDLGTGGNVFIVQFVTQALPEFSAQIDQLGGKVYQFIPNYAYLVHMDAGTQAAVAALPFVRWVGAYEPGYRVEEVLRDNRANLEELFPYQRYNIQVFEAGLKQKHAVAERIKAIGGLVNEVDAGKYLLQATLTPEQLWQVVTWDEVHFVDRWGPYGNDMNNAREYGGANYIEAVAGYDGTGVRGEVFDAGFNVTHVDFASRPLIPHGTCGSDSHGASTSGIVFGDGTGDPTARGMLPAGQGIIGDYNTIGLTGPTRYQHTGEETQAPYYCVFETSSVGSPQVTNYTTDSADTDAALFDFDILHCQSQSNMGSTSSRPQAWAKNILSGGAAYHYDTLSPLDDCWCGGASIGPATDGRIKPDLCAYYDAIHTTTSGSTTAYTNDFGGTSGATPIIAGHCGLFFEMWADGIFGNEVDPGGTVFSNRPHMTTAKAVMINNAKQYPFTGGTSDLTRVHQGWGWPNLQNVYDRREKMYIVNETELLQELQSVSYALNVDAGEPEFKATLVYADPPGSPTATVARINDLTLRVTAPDGQVYWGNNGLLTGNYSTPGGTPNHVDTVENVFVQNPAGGLWVVEVIADEINQDSHLESPEMDADFALVISGVTPCSSAGSVRLSKSMFACESMAEVRVLDCDLNADPEAVETITVLVSSDSEPAGEPVVLTETGPGTAAFRGPLTLSTTNAVGVLWVTDGNVVTATYIDADDGQGHYNLVRTATAVVDCLAPEVFDVVATDIEPRTAHVSFEANEPVSAVVFYGLACGALEQQATVPTLSYTPSVALTGLEDNTTYYFAVQATDAAGNFVYDDNGGACYPFTTPEVPDFFTELFETAHPNDMDNLSLLFVPNGSNDFYHGCVTPITMLPTDPTGGTTLTLTDDSYATITPGTTVYLYGTPYTTLYVGSNGYVTFGSGDSDYTEALSDHFAKPRVAALFDDLNPTQGGTVSWRLLADRVAVTWLNVTEHNGANQNTCQIELFFDGRIGISYLAIAATDGLAGLSEGLGLNPDFLPSDLSTMGSCGPRPPSATGGSVTTDIGAAVTVTLVATDDGLPDPPAALTYTITSLPLHGTLAQSGGGAITTVPYTLTAGGNVVVYHPQAYYSGPDSFVWKANDGGVPPEGGDSYPATISILVGGPQVIYTFDMETNPGWTTEDQWAWGTPTGAGSHNHDPAAGHTGTSVYGYNLAGDYPNNMTVKYLQTTALDFTEVSEVSLKFWRWLGVESASYDHATVQVSSNGSTWTTVWDHTATSAISDAAWSQQIIDISAVADNQPAVYVRWAMGPTDGSVTYPGWNIDDVEFWGMVPVSGPMIGDLNCDGLVNTFDIDPFVLALTDAAAYAQQYPECDHMAADINGDGNVNTFDIDPFVLLLTGG